MRCACRRHRDHGNERRSARYGDDGCIEMEDDAAERALRGVHPLLNVSRKMKMSELIGRLKEVEAMMMDTGVKI